MGGYAFLAGRADEVFLLSAPWPGSVRAALEAAADQGEAELRRAGSSSARPYLAMPAAELFGQLCLPTAISRLAACSCVYAAGDCEPSGSVVAALHSGNAQMRVLVNEAASRPWSWVSAHVPREANRDADRLSHPAELAAVRADAEAARLRVTEVHLLNSDWAILDRAIVATAPSEGRPRKRRR